MTTAFDYVSEVLEIEQEEGEDRDAFLQRVAQQIQNLPEDGWNDLPTELQDWYNKTADMLADSEQEVIFDDIPGAVKEEKKSKKTSSKKVVEDAGDEPEEKAEPKKRGRKPGSVAKEPKEPKAPKEPKPPKEPKEPKGPIAANSVREILCEDMNTTLDQLMEKLTERGVVMQRSSAQVVHLNTIRAFEVAVQMGEVSKDGKVVLTTA